MFKINKKLTIVVASIVAVFGGTLNFLVNDVEAKRAIAVSPMSQKIVLVPGETYQGSITVANPASSTEDLRYTVTAMPYTLKASEDGKNDYEDYVLDEKNKTNEIADWTTIKNANGILSPNNSATVMFTVKVPKSAPAGVQYMALVVAEDGEAESENTSGVNEIIRMAHIVYARVAGETIEKGSITENNFPSFLLDNALEATSIVENNGNVYTDAEYTLQVWPMGSSEEICTNEEAEKENRTSLILPDTKKYHKQSCNLPNVGIYNVKQTVKIFGEESVVEKTVIYCPIWMMLVILFGIALIIIWLFVSAAGRKKKVRELA